MTVNTIVTYYCIYCHFYCIRRDVQNTVFKVSNCFFLQPGPNKRTYLFDLPNCFLKSEHLFLLVSKPFILPLCVVFWNIPTIPTFKERIWIILSYLHDWIHKTETFLRIVLNKFNVNSDNLITLRRQHQKYETDHRLLQKKSGNSINSCQKSVKNKRANWKWSFPLTSQALKMEMHCGGKFSLHQDFSMCDSSVRGP